ncbi:MAG: SpoIIE family protein phosphatase [Clostridiales bacterium]|nr:SpoIIE family protein phosphatase [Clostridiales bacterium]
METYLPLTVKLFGASCIIIALSVMFYILDKRTTFKNLSHSYKQIIIGVLFGAAAIFSTEFGVDIGGATANCRDAAALSAGLLFGPQAGIIAGLIGGVERYLAAAWGVGEYSKLACSLSTVLAGFFAGFLRKYMFDNKKPTVVFAFSTGAIMEVIHMTVIFLTKLSDPVKAFHIVKICSMPMMLVNGLSVMLSTLAITLLAKRKKTGKEKKERSISQLFQTPLLAVIVLSFILSTTFTYFVQTSYSLNYAKETLEVNIKDIISGAEKYPDKINEIADRHIGKSGFVFIADSNGKIVSNSTEFNNKDLNATLKGIESARPDTVFNGEINGESYICEYTRLINPKVTIATVLPSEEVYSERDDMSYVNTHVEILIFAALFTVIYFIVKEIVVKKIRLINKDLGRIINGDLETKIDVYSSSEFASLSNDINSTINTLKQYIAEAAGRIDKELAFAKNIQHSALPNIFPNRPDFDIYATMDTAKEVGGDFYDFYMNHSKKLNLLIADVSGKGIPAAMFMMRAKSELKGFAELDIPIDEVFTNANEGLCEGNDAGMFVTAWQAQVNLENGAVDFTNAGHNPPVIKRAGEPFTYLKSKAGLVLAGMEGFKYKKQSFQLEPGDIIFLYTDGVTEATDKNNDLFGEERLLDTLNNAEFDTMQDICRIVKEAVDEFVGDSPQFDDITMLAFKYIGTEPIPSIESEKASIDDIPKVTEFVETELEKYGCDIKTINSINIVIDEIYSNISKFAYGENGGPVKVQVHKKKSHNSIELIFTDEGRPYNPLMKSDPNITLSAQEREIGGLGIFMVKKIMDEIKYEYIGGKNILTMEKKI